MIVSVHYFHLIQFVFKVSFHLFRFSGSDYSDSLCNVTSLIRELTALTGLEMEDTAPAVDTVRLLSPSLLTGKGSAKTDSSSRGEVEIDGVLESEVVDEEEDESLLAEALLVTDVSATLTNISDLPGERQTHTRIDIHTD
jgi:hypothetical protein